jgi:hypothetical protein
MENNSLCKGCGASIFNAATGRTKLWCSKNCGEFHRKKESGGIRYGNCDVCGSQFLYGKKKTTCSKNCAVIKGRDRAKQRYYSVTALIEKPATRVQKCGWCGLGIEVAFSDKRTNLYHESCKVSALRRRNKNKSLKRQGAKTVQRIDFSEVALRDSGLCHICGDAVDLSLPRTSRMGATLDHVIPISRGGLDLMENVRLAHWICNIRKSDSLEFVNGQPR